MSPEKKLDAMKVIREEQASSADSSTQIVKKTAEKVKTQYQTCKCQLDMHSEINVSPEMEKILKQKETQLQKEFEIVLQVEVIKLKDKFDFILRNEQVRTSFMLREAHRERQEKISALQTQLESKNLAGLMYVLCSERRKSKFEKLKLIAEYTKYINALHDILRDSQEIILNLSRGYRTASRVDHEWREKMNNILKEFQTFIYNFGGGSLETNQYFLDIPCLVTCHAPVKDDLEEDSCDYEEEVEENLEPEHNKGWWEKLDGENRPFVMFGDMADFKPPERRQTLKTVKATKTAPRRWKEYVFNEMSLKGDCPNADTIKDEYMNGVPPSNKWECHGMQTSDTDRFGTEDGSRRFTISTDMKNMGSLLRIITTTNEPVTKANLLGARDSMEIASSTRLRGKMRESQSAIRTQSGRSNLKMKSQKINSMSAIDNAYSRNVIDQDEAEILLPGLGDLAADSLKLIPYHVADIDSKINYEKVCPVEKCQRMQVDSFIRSLPPYMRTNPFTHFEQNFDEYEACSPEQLEILMQRIEGKKKKEMEREVAQQVRLKEDNTLDEWNTNGVSTQTLVQEETDDISMPPCTCNVPQPSPVDSKFGIIFNVEDLAPVKVALDQIKKDCFYDANIQFNRFKVLGQDSDQSVVKQSVSIKNDFTRTRLDEIQKILKKHPSLCEIFQANTKC